MPKPVVVPPFSGTPEDLARALLRPKATDAAKGANLKKGQPASPPARQPASPPARQRKPKDLR